MTREAGRARIGQAGRVALTGTRSTRGRGDILVALSEDVIRRLARPGYTGDADLKLWRGVWGWQGSWDFWHFLLQRLLARASAGKIAATNVPLLYGVNP